MSLQIWLPLNGSLTNQGLTGTDGIATNATIDNSGKLGKCYSFAGRGYITVNNPETIPTLNFSISVWALFNDETSTMGLCTCRTATGKGIALFKIGNGLRFDVSTAGTQINSMITANQWYHIAATYDGSKTRLYVNGELKQELSKSLSSIGNISSIGWCIGASSESLNGNGNYLQGKMNDFRTYNHCLSTKEIKEISQGLFCHYKMDNVYEIPTMLNLYQANKNGNSSSNTSGVITKTVYSDYTNYKLNYTGTGSNNWPNIYFPTFSFTAGKRYWYSLKYRVNSASSGWNFYIRRARFGNDYFSGNGFGTLNSGQVGKGWVEVSGYRDLSATYTEGSNTYTTAPHIELYTDNLNVNGTKYTMDFDIKDVQIIQCQDSVFPGFIDNTLNSGGIIEDCSGWGNNAVATQNLSLANGNKYLKSISFDGSSSYIKMNPMISSGMDQFTVSCWFYTKEKRTSAIYNDRQSTGKAFSIFLMEGGVIRIDDNTTMTSSVSQYPLNTWTHIAFTWAKGGKKRLYINGVLDVEANADTTYSKTNSIASIGSSSYGSGMNNNNYLYGYMNDFRVYATALSADDVKALYSVRTAIDNKSNIYSGELIEKDGVSGFEKNFTAHSQTFTELPPDFELKYDNTVYVEQDGTKWVRIFHHSHPRTKGHFSSSDTFTTSVYKDEDRWFNVSFCNKLNKWEIMVKERLKPEAEEIKFRFIQPVNPMTATFDQVASAKITKISGQGYLTIGSAYGGFYKKNSSTYLAANDGNSGDWFGAVGSWTTSFNDAALPAYNGTIVYDGYMDLYVRVDNQDFGSIDVAGIGKTGYVKSKSFIEN